MAKAAQSRMKRRSTGLLPGLLAVWVLYAALCAALGTFTPVRLVKGQSMEPTLVAGDLAVVRSVPYRDLRVGDIVAFKTPEAFKQGEGTPPGVLHRIVGKTVKEGRPVLVTKGDNNDTIDAFTVPAHTVEGLLVMRVPMVGKPMVFLTSRQGMMFVAVLSLLALLFIPAMAMFYMTVLNRPSGQGVPPAAVPAAAAVALERQVPSFGDVAGALGNLSMEQNRLAREQAEFRSSIIQLSESVAYYAQHLRSHTAVVENLAGTTAHLETVLGRLQATLALSNGNPSSAPSASDAQPAPNPSGTATGAAAPGRTEQTP